MRSSRSLTKRQAGKVPRNSMQANVRPVAVSSPRATGSTVQRRSLNPDPFTPEQRATIISRFEYRSHDVARIAVDFRQQGLPAGHSEIQKVIRQRLLESTGRRREDIAARRAS